MQFESSCTRTPLRHRFRGQKWYQLGIGQERLYKNKNDAGARGYVPELGNTLGAEVGAIGETSGTLHTSI